MVFEFQYHKPWSNYELRIMNKINARKWNKIARHSVYRWLKFDLVFTFQSKW